MGQIKLRKAGTGKAVTRCNLSRVLIVTRARKCYFSSEKCSAIISAAPRAVRSPAMRHPADGRWGANQIEGYVFRLSVSWLTEGCHSTTSTTTAPATARQVKTCRSDVLVASVAPTNYLPLGDNARRKTVGNISFVSLFNYSHINMFSCFSLSMPTRETSEQLPDANSNSSHKERPDQFLLFYFYCKSESFQTERRFPLWKFGEA